jgi:hypothetical protein
MATAAKTRRGKDAPPPDKREEYRGPLGSYAVIGGLLPAAFGAAVWAGERSGRRVPERLPMGDLLLLSTATFKLSRLIARDTVTGFLRAPFTEYQEPAGHGEVEERARGRGPRLAIGKLLVCPACLGLWVAGGFLAAYQRSPRMARWAAALFTVHAVSDTLQLAYRAAEDRV